MDIHKPKPWHGFREFLKEYVIIVIGVLTALGAEAVVEWAHWRHQGEVARAAIAFDLRRLVGEAARKDAASPCTAERLHAFADALDQAQQNKRLPGLSETSNPLSPAWTFRSWYGLTSGQTLAHLSNRDELALSAIANYVDYLRPQMNEERAEWAVLRTMIGPGRPTSDAEIASLRAALGRAGMAANNQRGIGRGLETAIVRSGFLSRAQIDAAYGEGVGLAAKLPICHPPVRSYARSSDAVTSGLTGQPERPGDEPFTGVGVGGALTTDR